MKLSRENVIDLAKCFAEKNLPVEFPPNREMELNAVYDSKQRRWVVTFDAASPQDELRRRSVEAMRAGRREEALSLGHEWMRQRTKPTVMCGTGRPPPLRIIIVDDETGESSIYS